MMFTTKRMRSHLAALEAQTARIRRQLERTMSEFHMLLAVQAYLDLFPPPQPRKSCGRRFVRLRRLIAQARRHRFPRNHHATGTAV